MKIINWNVGRPSKNKCESIIDKLNDLNGDIVILTETNSSIIPKASYMASSKSLAGEFDGIRYEKGENRASIWTKFPIVESYNTSDKFSNVCTAIQTPIGLLTVYATIIGVFGGKGQRFQDDLQAQLSDFEKLFPDRQICLAGDYNISFSGYAYPSHFARQKMDKVFQRYKLTNLTAGVSDCVDHIAISDNYLKNKKAKIETWNLNKRLSDHIGISVTLVD